MLNRFLLLIFLGTLQACVTTQEITEDSVSNLQQWHQRQPILDAISHWHIRGRVALFVNDEVHNLGLDWHRQDDHSTITLEAPLGQGMVKLDLQPGKAVLNSSEGDHEVNDNPDQLLMQATGWSIPVTGLSSWITGNHHAQSGFEPEVGDRGLLQSLIQDNWRINFLNYEAFELPLSKTVLMPQKIYMKRDQLALKIVIDQWQAADATPSELFPDFPR